MTSLRIADASVLDADPPASGEARDYLARLIRLIPAEVVGLYLVGKTAIQTEYTPPAGDLRAGELIVWACWTLFCLTAVVAVRALATRVPDRHLGPEWPAVLISAASFVVWVYSMGDLFQALGVWSPLPATLLVLAVTFVTPLLYRERVVAPLAPVATKAGDDDVGPLSLDAPPALTLPETQEIVLTCATRGGSRPGLWTPIKDRFDSEHGLRKLLAEIGAAVSATGRPDPDLGRIPPKDVKDLLGQTYAHLSLWVCRTMSGAAS